MHAVYPIRPFDLRVGPSDGVLADVVPGDAQRIPHSLGRVDDVRAARRLVGVRLVAAVEGVALVYDLGEHGPALGSDPYVLAAAHALSVPPRGERHDALRVLVETTVALRWVATVTAFLEVVERHDGPGAPRDGRRARVRRVGPPGLAALAARGAALGRPQRAARLAPVGELALAVMIGVDFATAAACQGDQQDARRQCKHEAADGGRHLVLSLL